MALKLQIKAQLVGAKKPPVWRRLVLPSRLTFYELHLVLQEAMGWLDYHLYEFVGRDVFLCEPDHFEEFGSPYPDRFYLDPKLTLIHGLMISLKTINYFYDFGDGWQIKLTVEKIVESDNPYPYISDWRGEAPPEDCGGIPGFDNLRAILADPEHPEYADMLDWTKSQDYGPFDRTTVNSVLEDIFFDPGFVHMMSPYDEDNPFFDQD